MHLMWQIIWNLHNPVFLTTFYKNIFNKVWSFNNFFKEILSIYLPHLPFEAKDLICPPHLQEDELFIQHFCSSLVPHEMREIGIVCISKMFSMQITCCVFFFAVLKVFLERDYFEKSVLLSSCVHTQCLTAAWWGQSQGHILDWRVSEHFIWVKTTVALLEWSCCWRGGLFQLHSKQKEGEKRREDWSSAYTEASRAACHFGKISWQHFLMDFLFF